MLRNRWMSALPLLVLTALAVPQLGAAEIRDRAGMFSAEAVRKAQAEFDRSERSDERPRRDRDHPCDPRPRAGRLSIREADAPSRRSPRRKPRRSATRESIC